MEFFDTEDSQNFEYFYSFVVSGCIGLLQIWIENDMKESPEKMAILVEEMIVHGIKVLQ